jgi:hypothetical protein
MRRLTVGQPRGQDRPLHPAPHRPARSTPEQWNLIRTSLLLLLFAPFVLVSACADQLVTPDQEALEHHRPGHGGGDDSASGSGYEVVVLGTLPGQSSSWAVDITDAGEIVGTSWGGGASPDADGRIFRWIDSGMEEVAPGRAHGTNSQGAIATVEEAYGNGPISVLHDGARSLLYGSSRPDLSLNHMINDAGTVAGPHVDGAAVWMAASYDEPAMLGTPGFCDDEGYSCSNPQAWAINSHGDVAGRISVTLTREDGSSTFYGQALIWLASDPEQPRVLRPGPAIQHSLPRHVNDQGWIVGTFRNHWAAAIWIPDVDGVYGEAIELPRFDDSGSARGRAISEPDADGTVRIAGWSNDKPVLWTVDQNGTVTGPVDLGTPKGYDNAEAVGLNNEG